MAKISNLVRISTYAQRCNITIPGVIRRIANKVIVPIEIDGVRFIDMEAYPPEGAKRGKNVVRR